LALAVGEMDKTQFCFVPLEKVVLQLVG
jgi:hypothetical protein